MNREEATAMAMKFIAFLETGEAVEGLFTDDVFLDFTLPKWRIQAQGAKQVIGVRLQGHSTPGKVPRWRCDPTPTGFVLEVEERWTQDGKEWYCREFFRADTRGGSIADLSVYCTGDWEAEHEEEHRRQVKLLRP